MQGKIRKEAGLAGRFCTFTLPHNNHPKGYEWKSSMWKARTEWRSIAFFSLKINAQLEGNADTAPHQPPCAAWRREKGGKHQGSASSLICFLPILAQCQLIWLLFLSYALLRGHSMHLCFSAWKISPRVCGVSLFFSLPNNSCFILLSHLHRGKIIE